MNQILNFDLFEAVDFGIIYLEPIHNKDHQVIDFDVIYINKAGSRLTGLLPQSPSDSLKNRIHQTNLDLNLLLKVTRQNSQFAKDIYCSNDHIKGWYQQKIICHQKGLLLTYYPIDDKKEIETILKERHREMEQLEQKYKTLVENTPDLIARVDRDYKYVFVNEERTRQILGIDPQFLIGKTPKDLNYPEAHVKKYYEALDKVFQGEEVDYYTNVELPGSKTLHFHTLLVPEREDNQDKIISALSISRNITSLKEVEIALKKTNRELQTLVKNIPDFIFRLDQQLHYLYGNPATLKRMSLKENELYGKHPLDLYPEQDIQNFLSAAKMTLNSKRPQLVYNTVNAREKTLYYRTLIIPEIADRQVQSLLCISYDITDLKQAEYQLNNINEELRSANEELQKSITDLQKHQRLLIESERKWRNLVENSVSIIVRFTADLRFEFMNAAFTDYTGIASDRLKGLSIHDIKLPAPFKKDLLEKMEAAKNSKSRQAFFHTNHKADQDQFFLSHIIPEYNESNQLEFFLTINYNISELKRNEIKLQEKTRSLIKVNQELESFSYTVSHDLRTPLRAISGFSAKLKKKLPSDDTEILRFLHIINENATKMGELIDDLLQFSRIRQTELARSRFPLSMVFREAIYQLKDVYGEDYEIIIQDLPQVYADKKMIRQVAFNLLSNAFKFNRKAPKTIEIGLKDDKVFYVKDNGIGFNPQFKHQIFKVFSRLNLEIEGSGIGLSIVSMIISKHNGRVWAEAEPGQGATFFFTLGEY
ncbi:MAG: PAS domain-containing sensor histidine kinase [Candidatus Cyclobacteriaceae bacterium M3_2C_046]